MNNTLKVIRFRDILYCKAEGNYTRIYLNKRVFLETGNLRYFESKLPAREFLRIHRSCLVNKSAIICFDGNRILLKNGSQLRLARRRKHKIMKSLAEYLLLIK